MCKYTNHCLIFILMLFTMNYSIAESTGRRTELDVFIKGLETSFPHVDVDITFTEDDAVYLKKYLTDADNPAIKWLSLFCAIKMKRFDYISSIINAFKTEQIMYFKMYMIYALSIFDDAMAKTEILRIAFDKTYSNVLRHRALLSYNSWREPSNQDALKKVFEDKDALIRGTACEIVGKYKVTGFNDQLVKCLSDRYTNVRIKAIRACISLELCSKVAEMYSQKKSISEAEHIALLSIPKGVTAIKYDCRIERNTLIYINAGAAVGRLYWESTKNVDHSVLSPECALDLCINTLNRIVSVWDESRKFNIVVDDGYRINTMSSEYLIANEENRINAINWMIKQRNDTKRKGGASIRLAVKEVGGFAQGWIRDDGSIDEQYDFPCEIIACMPEWRDIRVTKKEWMKYISAVLVLPMKINYIIGFRAGTKHKEELQYMSDGRKDDLLSSYGEYYYLYAAATNAKMFVTWEQGELEGSVSFRGHRLMQYVFMPPQEWVKIENE